MDLSKEIWHCELYKLQQQAPTPIIIKCNRNIEKRPPQLGDEYHGNIDRNEVEMLLSNYRNGAFLIRDSQRNVGSFTLVIRFDQSNKNYVLYYNSETRQHFVGSKYFDNIVDLVQDGLIHMYIETRGADILRKIAEAKVYEATPFYRSRFFTIQNENFRQNHLQMQKTININGRYEENIPQRQPNTIIDYNGSCDSGIFNSLRSDESALDKCDSSSEHSPQMSVKTIRDSPEDPPVAPPRCKSLYYSLRHKTSSRPSISSDSPSSTISSTVSSQLNNYEPIFNCNKTSMDDSTSDNQETSSNSSKSSFQRSPSTNQKSSNRHGFSRMLSNRSTLIECTNNEFSQLEKNHNFKQHTFVGPQWCDFCAHFMWGLVAQGVQCFDCGFQAHKKCSDKVAADCFPVMKRLKRVFGIELTSLAKMENRAVPIIFENLIRALEDRDMSFQGLYRISGNIEIIEDVKADLDKDIDSVDFTNDLRLADLTTLTGLIKLFLRQLPIPLITSELYSKLISILKTEPKGELQLTQFRDSMSMLNAAHYATLEFFIRHLNKVSKLHHLNCMTSSNLAIVFSPTLICKQSNFEGDMSPAMLISRVQSDFKLDCTIIQELIEECDSIFSKVALYES